ncbi:MAG: hypothetical protein MUF73_05900 [Rhodobacteraceae bacterium]|jgi:hypothetical protein|nr:hypothetical protein [Paracoccaceae bacterium]
MNRNICLAGLAAVVLAACAPQVPNSAAGVGFNDYRDYTAAREAQLRGQPAPGGVAASGGAAVAADTLAALGVQPQPGTVPTGTGPSPIERSAAGSAGAMAGGAPIVPANPGISDEQDFAAVSARETIESDRERMARQRAAMEQVAPQPVPTGSSGSANIVAYALATTHAVGQQRHRRVNLFGDGRSQANCARYASPDLAQEAFLSRGGPERDPQGLDPDGDGFACFWDPAPFRAARSAGGG